MTELENTLEKILTRGWVAPALVALLTFVTFIFNLENEFLNWDDEKVLVSNPHYRGLTSDSFWWMFTSFHMGHFMPVTWLSFSLDFSLWGMNPAGYHLTNIFLHTANAVVFYFLTLKLLTKALPEHLRESPPAVWIGATCAALLFSVHPLRVEAVAWVTARRDLLAGFFFLLTMLAYVKACKSSEPMPSRKWHWAALGFFGLSLLSKAIAVGLPLILLALDIHPLGRLGGRKGRWFGRTVGVVWVEKLPFFFLAVAASGLAFLAATHVRGNLPVETWGITERATVAIFGLAFYLWKALLPVGLSPLYELPDQFNLSALAHVLSAAVFLTITALAILLRHRFAALAVVWMTYVVLLLPVSGIFQTGPQLVADRYSYLPFLGWAVLIGGAIAWSWWRLTAYRLETRLLAVIAFIVIILSFQFLTVRQVAVWRDSVTLWSRAVAVDPASKLAHNNLGAALLAQGKIDAATKHFQQTLDVAPADTLPEKAPPTEGEKYHAIGLSLQQKGNLRGAETYYLEALREDPQHYRAWNNLGVLYAGQARFDEALEAFILSLRANPVYEPACVNGKRAARILGQNPPEINRCLRHEEQ